MINTTKFIPPYDVGYIGVSECCLKFQVISYKGRKNILIRFENNQEINTTSTKIKQNKVRYFPPTIKVGDKKSNKEGDVIEVLDILKGKVVLKWLSDGAIATRDRAVFLKGALTHPTKGLINVGDKFTTNNNGDVEVVEVVSAIKILVRFSDGSETFVTANALRLGEVGHPTCNIPIGYIVRTNSGYCGKVIAYNKHNDVQIEWEDGIVSSHKANNVRNGSIKPPTQSSAFGVGYWGVGRFVPNSHLLKEGQQYVPEAIKNYWWRMLDRTYNPFTLNKSRCKHYRDTQVSDDFKCMQGFAEWALSQPNWDKGFDLDKDLLGDGKIYSKDVCCFLPKELNIFLAMNTKSKSGLPEGVNYISSGSGGYVARCHFKGKREYLGFFKTPEEAGLVYRKRKEEVAKLLAEEYKDVISPQAYEALLKYEVTMTET